MTTFKLAGLPRDLCFQLYLKVHAEGDAVYVALSVFDVKNPDDIVDFQICLAKKVALQLAADLNEAVGKI